MKEAEAGKKAAEPCRQRGIAEATYYNRKAKFVGITVSDSLRLKALEAERAKLNRLLAKSMLDNAVLIDVPGRKRQVPEPANRG